MWTFRASSRPGISRALAGMGILIVATAIGGADVKPGPAPLPATQPSGAAAPRTSGPAATTPPGRLILPAILVPDEQVDLHAKASGYVSKVSVDIGSRVRRGDVLVQLDVPELTDQLHQAEAVLRARQAKVQSLQAKVDQAALLGDSARAELARYEAERDLANITLARKTELHQQKAIPDQEFDVARNAADLAKAQIAIGRAKVAAAEGELAAARADVKAADADVAVARADLNHVRTLIGYTTLVAPFDGVVTHRDVDHGDFVRSAAQGGGSALLTVAKVDVLRLVVEVPEASAPQVHVGTAARVEIRSLGDEAIDARVSRTARAIRQNTRTMRTEIDLDNRDGRLIPGLYARAQLDASSR